MKYRNSSKIFFRAILESTVIVEEDVDDFFEITKKHFDIKIDDIDERLAEA